MSPDPLDAKAVRADTSAEPSGAERAAAVWPMTPTERTDFAQGIAANAERYARMTDIDRKLDDLEARRG